MNVLLKYDDPAQAIETVAVIGAFNDYDPVRGAMRQEADGWHFACTLPQGEYPYRFLINGELEVVDPYNGLHDIDSTDKLWSLLLIDANGDRLFNAVQQSVTVADYNLSPVLSEASAPLQKHYTYQKDKQVVACFTFENIVGIHVATVAWYTPDGKLHSYADNAFYEEKPDATATVWFWLSTEEVAKGSTPGAWSLRLFLNGQWMLEDTFTIEKTSGLVYQRV